jgi:TetR/AcrR family tetracycline transcriptional repressor
MGDVAADERVRDERAPLTRERVFEAALAIVDSEGLEALSMRRLGTVLGVDPMAVYRHVDGKDAVLDGVAGLLWGKLPPPETDEDWVSGLRSFARALLGVFRKHPHAAPLLIQRFVLPRPALEAVHAHLEALRAAGLDEQRAAQVVRSLLSYAMGYGLLELTCCGEPGLEEWERMTERERLLCMARGLPEGIPGHLIDAAASIYAECEPEACFESGLELFIAGVSAQREEAAPAG